MTTKLKSQLKREVTVGKLAYTLTIDSDGFKLVPKGKRKGLELAWSELVSGDAAMAVALRASLDLPEPAAGAPEKPRRKKSAPA
jgi:hypothetical protein